MNKKMISLFTLAFFTLFVYSCTTKKWRTIETMNPVIKRHKIVKVVNNSEEVIEFTNKEGGIIDNGVIKGVAFDSTTGREDFVSIPFSKVNMIQLKRLSTGKVLGLIAITIVVLAIYTLSSIFKEFSD